MASSSFTALVATPTTYIATISPLPVTFAYCCPACPHLFQLASEGRKPGVKEKIVGMAFNGTVIRNTARALNIGINTVLRALKLVQRQVATETVVLDDVGLIYELDEQWAYVGNKNHRN